MPCLNEAETIRDCIQDAETWIERSGLEAEVLISDNGSTDGSVEIAITAGAKVVHCDVRGYGAALRTGISAASGTYIVMGDADRSYDFSNLDPFIRELEAGADLVMGNRFTGGIARGAMPPLHRYLGNPLLSGIGRHLFSSNIGDFHCGIRGFRREAIADLPLVTTGMEFASEMVVKASLYGLRVTEVPTTLSVDGRSRSSHLRTWSDGWRHLRFMILFSPKWLFVMPGTLLAAISLPAVGVLALTDVAFGSIVLSTGTLLYVSALAIIGTQLLLLGGIAKTYAISIGVLPKDKSWEDRIDRFGLGWGVVTGIAISCFGVAVAILSFLRWKRAAFGDLNPVEQIRAIVPAVLAMVIGSLVVMASALLSMNSMRTSGVSSEFASQPDGRMPQISSAECNSSAE